MIVVDTSVWVEVLRNTRSPEAEHLRDLLDDDTVALVAPVRLEILGGASKRDRTRLRRTLAALPLYFPSSTTWERLDAWIDVAGDAHQRFGVADLLVAAIAADRDAEIWSLDSDFVRMQKLGFVRLHDPTRR
jgi:predicted nucleic acid-binding protein